MVYRNRKNHLYCSQKCYKKAYLPQYREENREHLREYGRRYEKRNREKISKRQKSSACKLQRKKWELRVKYGITLKQYNRMFKIQDGKCAICGQPEKVKHRITGRILRLQVDHNHKNGKIRGLLCWKCNRGIGCFNDNITFLQSAIYYLNPMERMR